MATHSSTLAWRKFPGQRSLAGYSPWVHKELDMTGQLSPQLSSTGNYGKPGFEDFRSTCLETQFKPAQTAVKSKSHTSLALLTEESKRCEASGMARQEIIIIQCHKAWSAFLVFGC